ncbi:MAG: hypothetical protein CML17_03510 [Pusillimonas sp.]|mgnify:CR=1 FL=1|nr:hypothetical protein [Pusillimonas sp.]
MADKKISQLTALTTQASADELVIVDSSASQTKRITVNNLFQGIPISVLVNSTEANPAQNNTSDAVSLHNAGLLRASTTNAAAPLDLNVKSRDGDIAQFRKDGTLIGNIGVSSSNAYFASSEFGIKPTSVGFVSTNTSGVAQNGAEDLGGSSFRWRNLYLSGGAYLGGTGSANLLDDYEEGTWTPEIADANTGGNTGTASTIEGAYTKVGRMVNLTFRCVDIDTTGLSPANGIRIRNLPFSSGSGVKGTAEGSLRLDLCNTSDDAVTITVNVGSSATYMTIRQTRDNANDLQLPVSALTSGTADIFGTITYFIN